MYRVIYFRDGLELANKLNGTLVSHGAAGTNSAGGSTLTEAGAFVEASAGDILEISGQGRFTVVSATANAATVSPVIPVASTGTARWRLYRGQLDPARIVGDVVSDGSTSFVLYDSPTFG